MLRRKIQDERDGLSAARETNELDDQLETARERASELTRRIDTPEGKAGPLALEAVEELRTTLEELQVTQQELREQNDDLLAARADLEAKEIRYEDLFDFAPDGYLVTDRDGLILEANRAAVKMLGVERGFLIRKPLASFVGREDLRRVREEINHLSRSPSFEAVELEVRLQPRKREPFEASLTVALSRDREQRRTTLRWLVRDITRRKQAEDQIREMNAELEERVRVRTAELERVSELKDDLLVSEAKARNEAETANRGKDEFLAMASHELRTPLNSILGWAQILSLGNLDDAGKKRAVEVIERSARAQNQIINDILDVSRIVTGNLTLDTEPILLAAVIEAAVEAARPAIDAKGISATVALDATAAVLGNADRLQQVFGNILSNAIKFTPAGGRIDLKLERLNDAARVTISDTGIGISAEFMPYVFDRFRQGDSALGTRQGGLGLGLAIVKSLIEMHGGTVEATSEGQGKGAGFTVSLPLRASSPAPGVSGSDYELERV